MLQTIYLVLHIYFTSTGLFSGDYILSFAGVVDRIEGNEAVILIDEKKEELLLPVHQANMPIEAGDALLIHMTTSGYQGVCPLPELTQERVNEAKAIMQKLRGK